jgi:hypothetical protein
VIAQIGYNMAICNHCGRAASTRICPRCKRVIKADPEADAIGCLILLFVFAFAYLHSACGK